MSAVQHKVSVIIPVYNVESSLTTCIDSVLRQTLKPYEIVVIDDGSSDKTESIAKSYGSKIIYKKQENQGPAAARNAGLELAKGDFIAFLDADDYWREGFLERCTNFLDTHKNAIAVSTGIIVILLDGKEQIMPPCLHDGERMQKPIVLDDFFKFWAEQNHIRTGSNIIRKSVIDEAGFQQAGLRVGEDLEYWGYIATFGKWGFLPEPLWVCNSQAGAAAAGWLERYQQRRSLCPTVEAWGKRIVPRLKDNEITHFEIVRGRVAANYAHYKILAGDFNGALDIVQEYGASMPRNKLTLLMRAGPILGIIGWRIVCFIIRLKESIKAWGL